MLSCFQWVLIPLMFYLSTSQWLLIERVLLELHVLAATEMATGDCVEAPSRDFVTWFRIFLMSNTRRWKD